MLRLFRDPQDTRYWFAYSIKTGWVKFPPAIDSLEEEKFGLLLPFPRFPCAFGSIFKLFPLLYVDG